MPMIQVTMLEGRSVEQKRRLAQRLTDAMVEEAGRAEEAQVNRQRDHGTGTR